MGRFLWHKQMLYHAYLSRNTDKQQILYIEVWASKGTIHHLTVFCYLPSNCTRMRKLPAPWVLHQCNEIKRVQSLCLIWWHTAISPSKWVPSCKLGAEIMMQGTEISTTIRFFRSNSNQRKHWQWGWTIQIIEKVKWIMEMQSPSRETSRWPWKL